MDDAEPPGRLDLKIARDRLMKNVEPLWDELCAAVEQTCTKLRNEYSFRPTVEINEHNSVIRVSRSKPLPEQAASVELKLELRFDRSAQKIIARMEQRYSRQGAPAEVGKPVTYQIAADVEKSKLYFSANGKHLSAIDCAENEIAERLMEMKL